MFYQAIITRHMSKKQSMFTNAPGDSKPRSDIENSLDVRAQVIRAHMASTSLQSFGARGLKLIRNKVSKSDEVQKSSECKIIIWCSTRNDEEYYSRTNKYKVRVLSSETSFVQFQTWGNASIKSVGLTSLNGGRGLTGQTSALTGCRPIHQLFTWLY